jgi:DNA polymerase
MADAPGRQENETGKQLVGRVGKYFDKLIGQAGITREQVLLMNAVRCHPPSNALGSHPYALHLCNDWTIAEFQVYDPEVVVLLGKTAIQQVFPGAQLKVGEVRGQIRTTGPDHEYGARTWVATYHPSALMRNPSPELTALVAGDIRLAAGLLGVKDEG